MIEILRKTESGLKVFNNSIFLKPIDNSGFISKAPKPYLYLSVFSVWIIALIWFGPRLLSLMDLTYDYPSFFVMLLFIAFVGFAWLYGFYNVGIIIFSFIHRYFNKKPEKVLVNLSLQYKPDIAILYTTCNDFMPESVVSCVNQDYPNFKVYILDDSTDETIMDEIDQFASRYKERIKVVRRTSREGFKAGNMNYGLENYVFEKYFAIADADEILPPDFLSKLVPVMESDPMCGFVQANHRANTRDKSELVNSLGVGVDIHWKYYQPLRNDYGFVMFLGHGALIRRRTWQEIGGFPHIVSEDLGFAIHAREKGYRGRFVEDVICLEDFPESVRSFRIRHIKWTRGTCEFLHKKFKWLVRAKNISWTEKLDILFPTLNLPLTLLYFIFMVVANLLLPLYFGKAQDLTLALGTSEFVLPIYTLSEGFESIYTLDFFLITIMTFFAPVLCFVVALIKEPVRLFKFISHSTAIYASLGILSSIGVLTYLISGKATFLVTGDKEQHSDGRNIERLSNNKRLQSRWKKFLSKSHPDDSAVQLIEVIVGVVFAIVCVFMFQISFLGLCLAFVLMPLLHHIGWKSKMTRLIAHLPFVMILIGIFMAGLSLVGMQTVFFGYGFHF